MAEYITKQFDRLDRICRKYYGTEGDNNVLAVLEANPGLELNGITLPQGITITMPDLPKKSEDTPVIRTVTLGF